MGPREYQTQVRADSVVPFADQGTMGTGVARSDPPGLESRLGKKLEETTNPDAIVVDAPNEQSRLSFTDASCLIINRMIGTGIFSSPQTVISGTRSAGGAILLWFFGTVWALAGIHVYIEYGLNVPRFVIEGVEQAVPRSGGDLHYLSFVYSWPHYKKGTVLYAACLYGISFICVGNMAGNCVNFGIRVLLAANPHAVLSHHLVNAIATAAAAFSCVIHAVSRRGGILLNNFLAIIKVCILLIIPFVTFAVLARGIKQPDGTTLPNVFLQNMDPSVAFQPPRNLSLADASAEAPLDGGNANSYATAFLSIVFAFGGIEQSNHVLGEIKNPRRTFPRAATFAVSLVGLLYVFVNLCYMAVVPANEQSTEVVALLFFQKVFGQSDDDMRPSRIFNSFLALSSFGNIIVTTYTAARMKQEIAKQGFIPFPQFFARNADVSIGRLVLSLRKKGWNVPFFSAPEQHQEVTPVGALVLHMGACLVLIWSTTGIASGDAYTLLTSLSAYLITAFFGFFLALGILILRVRGPPATGVAKTKEYRAAHAGSVAGDRGVRRTWRDMTGRSVHAWLSIPSATLYLLGTAFPVVVCWMPGPVDLEISTVSWFVVPTICWVILAVATLWWLGFLAVGQYRQRRQHKSLVHEVWPEFDWAVPSAAARNNYDDGTELRKRQRDGGKVLVHETVQFTWKINERGSFWDEENTLDRFAAFNGPIETPTNQATIAEAPGHRQVAELHSQPPHSELATSGFEDFGTPAWDNTQRGSDQDVPWR